MPIDHTRLRELFIAACDLPEDQQRALIELKCGGDADFRSELEQLLRQDKSQDGLLADGDVVRGVQVHIDSATPPDAPATISRYTIKRLLGRGGMGVVWLAEQENPKRDVAVKVIRSGYMARELQRRFDLEAAVLGRLQHAGIAQVYEAGMFDDGSGGKPFFAMEFVDGRPLSEYALQHDLTVRERLQMFMQICDAVHHAHQRGVIHRDLKPANILVTASGQPKILDFGVARATDSDLQMTTQHTDVGQLIGTLPYMSPEQVTGRGNDIDTRSDVYALGIILYELLVGRLPYDLGDRTIVTAARVISETEPAPLSTVNRNLRGDLNTIVLKALEKEPDRRYQSAQELAADVKRFLGDEPIVARPATTMYQLRKFARRNKALVGGVVAALLALLGGIIGTTIGMVHAQREASRATAINDFMTDILVSIDPAKASPDVKLVDVLRDASDTVTSRFADLPESQNQVHTLLGSAFAQLSVYPESLPHLKSVFEFTRDRYGETDSRTLLAAAAYLRSLQHAGHISTALSIGNDLVSAMTTEQRDSREGMQLRRQIANASDIRRHDAGTAREDMASMLDVAERKYGDNDLLTVNLANDLAIILMGDITRGRSEDPHSDALRAAELLRFALGNHAVFKGNIIEESRSRLNLADALVRLGELDEALTNVQPILDLGAPVFGENHAMLGRAYRTLADIHWQKGDMREAAENWAREADIDRRRDGDNSIFALATMSDSLPYLEAGGLFKKGEEYVRILMREMGATHADGSVEYQIYLARFLAARGATTEAKALFDQAGQSEQLASNRYFNCIYYLFLGEYHLSLGNVTTARAEFQEAQQIRSQLRETSQPSQQRLDDALARLTQAEQRRTLSE